jgi:transcriptional regulator of heat shock response
MLQQSFEAEKTNHELKQKELNERLQKLSNDLDKMTRDYTSTFNELNELKKKLSSTQNEQTLLQRRMTELIKRHEEQMIEKEKECLTRLTQRDDVNRTTFNELRNLVNRQQRMIVKYDEIDH